jgi:hypothetical protein
VSELANPYDSFRASVQRGDLREVLLLARALPRLELVDALEVLVLMARAEHPGLDRASARWVGRLLAENNLGLRDGRFALALVERLPEGRDALHRLTHFR